MLEAVDEGDVCPGPFHSCVAGSPIVISGEGLLEGKGELVGLGISGLSGHAVSGPGPNPGPNGPPPPPKRSL